MFVLCAIGSRPRQKLFADGQRCFTANHAFHCAFVTISCVAATETEAKRKAKLFLKHAFDFYPV
jgi:hypothetical protein